MATCVSSHAHQSRAAFSRTAGSGSCSRRLYASTRLPSRSPGGTPSRNRAHAAGKIRPMSRQVHRRRAGVRDAAATAALVEQDGPVGRGVEEAPPARAAPRAESAVQDDGGLPGWVATGLPGDEVAVPDVEHSLVIRIDRGIARHRAMVRSREPGCGPDVPQSAPANPEQSGLTMNPEPNPGRPWSDPTSAPPQRSAPYQPPPSYAPPGQYPQTEQYQRQATDGQQAKYPAQECQQPEPPAKSGNTVLIRILTVAV